MSSKSAVRDELKIIYSGVVKVKSKKAFKSAKCRNLVLTNQPRLYLTTTLESDGKDGLYRSDILLFSNLKILARRGNLEITCPNSKRVMIFQTEDASEWKKSITKLLLDNEFNSEDNHLHGDY